MVSFWGGQRTKDRGQRMGRTEDNGQKTKDGRTGDLEWAFAFCRLSFVLKTLGYLRGRLMFGIISLLAWS